MQNQVQRPLIFPKWVDGLRPVAALLLLGGPVYALALLYYGGSPKATDVGYSPEQPVAYSHALHAGQLGIDCRYCHTTVEGNAFAAIPPTETCMNCHTNIYPQSPKLVAVRESYSTGLPVRWVKVHDMPDYVYFDHSAHVSRGVGCVECHGRVDKMEVVYQVETLSMGFCLDCHRDPDPRLRPVSEVTNMAWEPAGDAREFGGRVRQQYGLDPSEDCSTCHR
ncbi:MAG TPA: cytochrome c3 family protein [Candidatus Polarisedimenticolaceae bacterium]|nr:cytochrome c3 family protein [Candidatus Polarisedimenticolaceae bacterium]